MAEQPIAPARARFRTLSAARESSIPIEADDLVTLARRYADQGMYDESIHLYEMAEKLKPGSVAVRINLARVRDLKQAAETMRVGSGLSVRVCSIDDLIRMKRAAGRAKDRQALEELGGLRDERAAGIPKKPRSP